MVAEPATVHVVPFNGLADATHPAVSRVVTGEEVEPINVRNIERSADRLTLKVTPGDGEPVLYFAASTSSKSRHAGRPSSFGKKLL